MQPPDVTEAAAATMERLPPPADRLPTLTEVVRLGGEAGYDAPDMAMPAPVLEPAPLAEGGVGDGGQPNMLAGLHKDLSAASLLASPLSGESEIDDQALTERVLVEIAPRIDAMFEARLREALAPALARVADGLIREARDELAVALRDLVQDAVARTLRQGPAD